jgi:hypothetical protein
VIALWTVLVAAGFLGAVAFVVLYAWLARDWHHTPVGRNLMAMAAVLAGLLGLSLVAFLVRVWPVLWLGGMASLDAVLWWRVALLWRVQRRR